VRGGDHQLNRALHTIAITRAKRDQPTIDYLTRKQAEGNTRKGALRCLKRHLTRRFWRLLAEPPLPAPPAANAPTTPTRKHPARRRHVGDTITAPVPMACLT
jgi:hypothetical protein